MGSFSRNAKYGERDRLVKDTVSHLLRHSHYKFIQSSVKHSV